MTHEARRPLRISMKREQFKWLGDALKRHSPTKSDLWNTISFNTIALAIIISALIIRLGQ